MNTRGLVAVALDDMGRTQMTNSGAPAPYVLKHGPWSSHGRILQFLERLPRDARLLDVGTATGYLGDALRHRGFRRIDGIEIDAARAATARPFYDTLAVCDIEREALPWDAATFDIAICADILEHVREPLPALRTVTRLVRLKGWVIVSLPNVAHWSARLSLLGGRFRYTPSGIFDQGHLRFFTRSTARQLLREARLTVHQEVPTPLPIAHWCHGSAWSALWRIVERVDGALAALAPALFGYQLLYFAQRTVAGPEARNHRTNMVSLWA